jgi:hypothetical protein
VTFGPWYPLHEAAAHAPARPGVYQIRLAQGLLDYPTGKSAMVHYGWSDGDLRAEVLAFAIGRVGPLAPPRSPRDMLLCRHVEERYPRAVHDRLREQFIRRFGCPPRTP